MVVSGDLSIQDVSLNGDLTISGIGGSVTMRDSNFTSMQFVSITLVDGDLLIQNLILDGNMAISLVSGNVVLKDTDFTLTLLSVLLVGGSLSIQNNIQLNILVQETSGMVQIINNQIDIGNVDKNMGGVKLCRNVFESLSCVDNMPAPFGSDNTILSGTGQCATGL